MAYTQSDIDALKDAIKQGVRSVRYSDGRAVEYRDLDAMLQTLQIMQNEVNPSATAARCTYASYHKD